MVNQQSMMPTVVMVVKNVSQTDMNNAQLFVIIDNVFYIYI